VRSQPSFEKIESLLPIRCRDQGKAFLYQRGEQKADQRGIVVDDKDAGLVGRFASNRGIFPHLKTVSTAHAAHKLTCAKANPLWEAAEQLKLGELELVELNAFLASV